MTTEEKQFWDKVAITAMQTHMQLLSNPAERESVQKFAAEQGMHMIDSMCKSYGDIADALLAERRKRMEKE